MQIQSCNPSPSHFHFLSSDYFSNSDWANIAAIWNKNFPSIPQAKGLSGKHNRAHHPQNLNFRSATCCQNKSKISSESNSLDTAQLKEKHKIRKNKKAGKDNLKSKPPHPQLRVATRLPAAFTFIFHWNCTWLVATKSLVSATATLGIQRGGRQGREAPGIPGCHPRSRPHVPRLLPPPLAAASARETGRSGADEREGEEGDPRPTTTSGGPRPRALPLRYVHPNQGIPRRLLPQDLEVSGNG